MKPAIVMPMYDPQGIFFPHLKAITPTLQSLFERAYVSVPLPTHKMQPENMAWLRSQDFFQVLYHDQDVTVDVDFLALYDFAAAKSRSDQILHLCFIDRVAFALQTDFRTSFITDVQALTDYDVPLIFHRSATAWQTHPANYVKLEQIVTTVGEYLFGKTLDFAWCHLALQAHQLNQSLPLTTKPNLSMVAELIIHLRDTIQTKEVDWLAWEDPFIYGQNAQQLKQARENSLLETRKRLGYVIPMLQILEATIALERND